MKAVQESVLSRSLPTSRCFPACLHSGIVIGVRAIPHPRWASASSALRSSWHCSQAGLHD